MRRLMEGVLPPEPAIALLANDSLGNYVVATVVAQMIRRQYADSRLVLFSGDRVRELTEGCSLYDSVERLYGGDPAGVMARVLDARGFDWVLNLESTPMAMVMAGVLGRDGAVTGPCVGADGRGEIPYEDTAEGAIWKDREWASAGMKGRHPQLTTGFIGEVFARAAYLRGDVPGYMVERADPGEVPDVLIATAASLEPKLWPVDRWVELVKRLDADGLSVGLVGAKPSEQAQYWQGADAEGSILAGSPLRDFRGVWTLPQVVGALERAKFVVTLDNGILHLACATATPVVGLFRHGIHELWAPPVANLRVVEPGAGGSVAQISVDTIWDVLKNFQMPLAYF